VDEVTGRPFVMSLSAPGMTALHRAGLAGLWMTLDALDKEGIKLAGGSWLLSDHEVTMYLDGPGSFFGALIRESFKIDKDGLIWFPALGRPDSHPESSVLLNECLLGTFLQHGRSRKSDPANKPAGVKVSTIDETERPLRYHRVVCYAHQEVKIEAADQPQKLVGWVHPGGAVRHEAFKRATSLHEPLRLFLPLLYSIVGVLYFVVRKSGAGMQYAVVIPDVANLKDYATFRRLYVDRKEDDLTISGAGEAALRVLSTLKAGNLMDAVGSTACRVMTFGKVQWDKQQRKRVQVFDVCKDSAAGLEVYQKCRQFFTPRLVKPKAGDPFFDYPRTPELIAQNLLRGEPWWRGFSEFVSDQEIRNHVFGSGGLSIYRGEREGLSKMLADVALERDQGAFVEACQEAWRRRLGEISERARKERADAGKLFEREFERTRVSFTRCKNEAALREALADFWSRAGPLQSLQSNWRGALSLLNRDWRLAKDLALLSLASYAPKEKGGEEVTPHL
jgi:CRISPR-associated protein Cas8a1/Csx13